VWIAGATPQRAAPTVDLGALLVELLIRLAPLWRRSAAYLVDGIVLALPVAGIWWIDRAAAYPGALVLWLVYSVLMESSPMQATLGKRLVGLKVTDYDGNRISLARATVRFVFKPLSLLVFGIGYLMIAFTKKQQALHDMIAKTLVVKRRGD